MSYRRVQKEKKTTNYCIRLLVTRYGPRKVLMKSRRHEDSIKVAIDQSLIEREDFLSSMVRMILIYECVA